MAPRDDSPSRPLKRRRSLSPPSNPPSPSPPQRAPAPNLDETGAFVWRKKNDLSRKRGENPTPASEAARRAALRAELDSAKRRRAVRDAERAEHEAVQATAAREREHASAGALRDQAARFDGAQHFARQAIRLRANRPVAADGIARFARLDLPDVRLERRVEVPALLRAELASLPAGVGDAIEDELDSIPDFPGDEDDNDAFNREVRLRFWTVAKEAVRTAIAVRDASSVHEAVRAELEVMLTDKTLAALRDMQVEIEAGMKANPPDPAFADPDFWGAAVARVKARIAETELIQLAEALAEERHARRLRAPKESGTKDEDAARQRRTAKEEEDMVRAEEAKGMGEDEARFADEVQPVVNDRDCEGRSDERRAARSDGFNWNDRMRPRKPRHFNRVHTGYNWTKYNRTHYDHDNPPPKTVQGYKFNIFFPDLLDTSRTPTFSVSQTENPDVSIITFRSGPPYQPLAFKIVNRPWERSHKRGFRCSFDRGVLQLWFHFRRYHYRR